VLSFLIVYLVSPLSSTTSVISPTECETLSDAPPIGRYSTLSPTYRASHELTGT
jgi:hypothetical protein